MKQKSGYQLTETKVSKQWTISLVDKQFTVVIDAGHGGSDPGASSLSSRKEKDFTLPVANKVYKLLQQETSIRTLMTRTDDTYPTLDERVELANGQNADLFVSIHGNSFKEKPTVSGTETYYNRADSLSFANTMHKWILEATAFPDRSVRQADLKVTRETTMPAILLEIGYLSNAGDEARMYSDSFQDKLAVAIVNGIKEQLQITDSPASVKNAAAGSEDKSSQQAKAAGAGTVKTASEAGDKSAEQQTASKPKEETAADKTLQPAK
jgi:N-acetylmuramoyl-L-alanine amidase